jgi:hypothetical protein
LGGKFEVEGEEFYEEVVFCWLRWWRRVIAITELPSTA